MKIALHLDSQKILANQAQPVHLVLEFQAEGLQAPRTNPAAFCIVLDRSGSMAGPPLETAKRAAVMAVRNLRKDDWFGLAVFEESAQVVIPLQKMAAKEATNAVIARISSGGNTNLTAGWMLGRDELRKASDQTTRRLLLLSDGLLNAGITDPLQVRQIVAAGLEQDRIRTSCLGFGNNYDENLLTSLAQATNGEFYDAATPEAFPHIFEHELEGLQKMVVQNLRARVKALDFCDGFGVLSAYPVVRLPEGPTEIALGDLVSDEQRVLCLELQVLPLPWVAGKPVASLEGERLLEVEVIYDELVPEGIASRVHKQIVRIQATQDPAEVVQNESIVPWVAMQTAGQTMKAAMDQTDRGDRAGAASTLRRAIAALQRYGARERTAEALQMLEELLARVQADELDSRYRKSTSSRHYSSSRSSSRQRHWEEPRPPGPPRNPPAPPPPPPQPPPPSGGTTPPPEPPKPGGTTP